LGPVTSTPDACSAEQKLGNHSGIELGCNGSPSDEITCRLTYRKFVIAPGATPGLVVQLLQNSTRQPETPTPCALLDHLIATAVKDFHLTMTGRAR
jgi:hypothetical protein